MVFCFHSFSPYYLLSTSIEFVDANSGTHTCSMMLRDFVEWGVPTLGEYIEGISNVEKIFLRWGQYNKEYGYQYIIDKKIMDFFVFSDKDIIVGLTCFGGIAIWERKKESSKLLLWQIVGGTTSMLLPVSSEKMIQNKWMNDYCYRYVPVFNGDFTNELIIKDKLAVCLFNGTHDKLNDGNLLKYHQAGKPKKLAIKWHIGKSEYSAYFWFEEEAIREVFDKFYGAHPDTKTDFIIRIDAENKKYELALYRYGLKEPQIIPENVYQLLVFKNKFEDYRSDNYNQERGAWIW